MKEMILIITILVISSSVMASEPWDNFDKLLYGTWTGIKIIDLGQTHHIVKDIRYVERNGVIRKICENHGHRSVYGYFTLTTTAGFLIGNHLTPRWRKGFFSICGLIELALVITNAKAGIGIRY